MVQSPTMPLRVGVIGTGWAERVQIPALKAGGLTIAAVASRDPKRAREVASRHDLDFFTGNWHELLDRCELLVITSPPARHMEQTSTALAAGLHVICEKPLGLTDDEAEIMVRGASQRPNQLALVDHELRFTPVRQKARELLGSGVIGKVLVITARVATDARMDPTSPWNWWSEAAQGGGILNAIGSHILDGIAWLLPDLGPVEPRGATLGRTYPTRRDGLGTNRTVTADDIASVTFAMGDAVGTMLVHGASLDGPVDLLTLRGTEGTIVIDRSLKLYLGKRGSDLKEYRVKLPTVVPNRFRASAYAAGTVLFGSALHRWSKDGDPSHLEPAATLADGARVQRLLSRIRNLASSPR